LTQDASVMLIPPINTV